MTEKQRYLSYRILFCAGMGGLLFLAALALLWALSLRDGLSILLVMLLTLGEA